MLRKFPILLAAFITTASALAAPVVIDRLDASVNAAIILLSDVKKFRDTLKLRAQLDPLFAGTAVAAKGAAAPDSEVVDFLIDEKIISQQFPVTDAEVEQEINQIQTNNHIDRAQLRSALAEQGFKFEDYFELIRSSASKRNLIDRDIRTKVSISDDDVKNYFFNHYARSTSAPLVYHLEVITISARSYKNAAAVRETAQRALQAIRGGEDFGEVARRFSDDANASNGGDLGTVTEDQLSPAIRDHVKKLQIGQTSDVFGNASQALYIVKLLDLRTSDTERFDKMKDEIRNQLTAAEYQHQVALWLERQRQTAFIHKYGESSTAGLPLTQ